MKNLRLNSRFAITTVATSFLWLSSQTCVFGQNSQTINSPRFIEVSGVGTVYAVPDEIILVLGVKTWNKDIRVCYSQNQRIVEQVLAVAAKYKIGAEHIQTSEIYVQPEYPSSSDHSHKPDGFTVQKRITIVVKKIPSAPLLLADAIDSGANIIGRFELRIENSRISKDEARVLALKAAQEKAQLMAAQFNAKVGKVLSITESGSSVASLRNDNLRMHGYNIGTNLFQVRPGIADSSDENIEGDLAKGQLQVSSAVTVKFEIAD